MSKVGFLVGVGVGYVLGAKAGRRRYQQIKARADKVWQSPTVQHRVNDATQVVRDKAPELQHKVAAVAKDAGAAVKAKVGGETRPARAGRACARSRTSRGPRFRPSEVPHRPLPARSDPRAERAGGVLGWSDGRLPLPRAGRSLEGLTPGQLLAAWETAPALVTVTVGADHVHVFQNAASRALFGARELGIPLRTAFPEIPEDSFEAMDRVVRDGVPVQRLLRPRRGAGSPRR